MRRQCQPLLFGAVALGILCPFQLAASSFILSFSGVVDFASTTPAIPIGTPFSGEAIYNIPADTIGGTPPPLMIYWLAGPGATFDVTAGGYSFSAGPGSATVAVAADISFDSGLSHQDYLAVESVNTNGGLTSTLPGFDINVIGAQILGPAGALFTSSDLPTSLDSAKVTYGPSPGVPTFFSAASQTGETFSGYIRSVDLREIPPGHEVPEIDPASGTIALALLCGSILMIRDGRARVAGRQDARSNHFRV